MRRRLLISMIAVAVAAVLALGTPLAFVLHRLQLDEVSQSLHSDAQDVARDLYIRLTSSPPVDPAQAARVLTDRYVVIKEGPKVIYQGGLRPSPHSFQSATVIKAPFTVTVEASNSYLSGDLT